MQINFLPTKPGLRIGAVVLFDSSQNPILTLPLYGFADSPVAALAPNTGSIISTGSQATVNPYQIALDGAENFYVGDYSGKNVAKVPAGGGSATLVNFGTPGSIATQNLTGVALDGAGNLFVGDHQNSRILVVTPGGVVSVLSISGLSPSLGFPTALAFDQAGNLYIADFTNGRVVKVSSLVVAGSTASGLATVIATGSYSFSGSTLTGMAVDPQGTIYFAARTQNNSSIIKVLPSGAASVLPTTGLTPAVSNPQGVAADAMGNIYVVDTNNNRIVRVTSAGLVSPFKISGLPTPSTLGPTLFGVTIDPNGNLLISDWTNNRLVSVNVSSAVLNFANTNTGATSSDSPKTATVTNLGNQPLLFTTDPTYTEAFSNSSADTNPCTSSTSLQAGVACDVAVKFTPQTAGSLSAGITVTDNTLNVAGSTQQVSASGTAISAGDATATTVTVSPSSLANGQTATITATVADTATGHTSTIPTGSVTFTDTVGSTITSLNGGSAVSLNSGIATLTGVRLTGIGAHTITASYAGVSGTFLASTNTAGAALGKASVTITGPATQPVLVPIGQAGSAAIAVTGSNTRLPRRRERSAIAFLTPREQPSLRGRRRWQRATALNRFHRHPEHSGFGFLHHQRYLQWRQQLSGYFNSDRDSGHRRAGNAHHRPDQYGEPSHRHQHGDVYSERCLFYRHPHRLRHLPRWNGALGGCGSVRWSAAFTTSSLTSGTHTITAVYAGDANFTSATSTPVIEVIQDFSLSPSGSGAGTPTQTVLPGGTATYPLVFGPVSGTIFPGPVTLSVSGLPPGATATITPTTIPAGSPSTDVTLIIQLPQTTAKLLSRPIPSVIWSVLLLPFVRRLRRVGKRMPRTLSALLLAAAALVAGAGVSGCSSTGSGFFGHPQQVYSVVITATSGSISHSTTVALIVQ